MNQAGPGHRRRLMGSGDVGAVPSFPCLCFLGVRPRPLLGWWWWLRRQGKVTCFLGVDLGLSWVEVVATRKVTCESLAGQREDWASLRAWARWVRARCMPRGVGHFGKGCRAVPEVCRWRNPIGRWPGRWYVAVLGLGGS